MNGPDSAPDDSSEFLELMERVRNGSPEAWAEVVRDYVPHLERMARRQLPHLFRRKMGHSDLIQGTLLIAAREFPLFIGRTSVEFAHWLERILNGVAEDARQKFSGTAKRDITREVPLAPDTDTMLLPVDQQTPERIAEEKETCGLVRWALEQLRPRDRFIVEKHHYGGLTFEEIGRIIGRSEGATRALAARAQHRLADFLRQRYPKLREELWSDPPSR